MVTAVVTLLAKHTIGLNLLDVLGPFGPPVAGALFGAVAGWITTVTTVGSRERAMDRYRARKAVADAFNFWRAYIEHQRAIGFPDVAIPAGQLHVDNRIDFVVATYQETSALPRRQRERIEADVERLVGYQATFLTKDRAALPSALVNRDAEKAAKSIALIPDYKAGTAKRGLFEELAHARDDEREHCAIDCLKVIDSALADLRGHHWSR